jgi:hypothetical protein
MVDLVPRDSVKIMKWVNKPNGFARYVYNIDLSRARSRPTEKSPRRGIRIFRGRYLYNEEYIMSNGSVILEVHPENGKQLARIFVIKNNKPKEINRFGVPGYWYWVSEYESIIKEVESMLPEIRESCFWEYYRPQIQIAQTSNESKTLYEHFADVSTNHLRIP